MSKELTGDRHRPIVIRDAWENNLQGVSLEIPKVQLVAVTGASGAGKSSLVHHVIGRIGRRRFGRLRGVLSSLAPSYQPVLSELTGLPPCIVVRQEPLRGHSRSTIATYTGILDLLSSLLKRHGTSRSISGSPVEDIDRVDFAAWLLRHYEGASATLARVNPEMNLVSVAQLPDKGTIYYRDRNSAWSRTTRAGLKAMLPASLWVAIPDRPPAPIGPGTVRELVRSPSQGWLWVIDQDVYLEGGFHRVDATDPKPYLALGRRLFSFNSHALGSGKCDACHGIGVVRAVGESTLVRDPDLPILGDGFNLSRTGERFTHLGALDCTLRALLHLNHLSIESTWRGLPADLKHTILYGSGSVTVPELRLGDDRLTKAKRPFPGLISLVAARSQSTGGAAAAFQHLVAEQECPECHGSRYNRSARSCSYRGVGLADLMTRMTVGELHAAVQGWIGNADQREAGLLASLDALLDAYIRLNLGYLLLGRNTRSLSGGESQRIRLGLGLALRVSGCCYLLDEPSRGLHARDAADLSGTIRSLCQGDNTVLMVEHNPLLLDSADHLVVLGPGGGSEGGQVTYQGKPDHYPDGQGRGVAEPVRAPTPGAQAEVVAVKDLSVNNVRGAAFSVPVGRITAVVGVSGAGKSSAILQGFVPAVEAALAGRATTGRCSLSLSENIRFVEVVAQRMLGQNRRSVVATALELFNQLREHFAGLDASRSLGLKAADFSFNSDGACEACGGTGCARDGFGNETEETCHVCGGRRLGELPLLSQSNGLTIADLLDFPVADLVKTSHPSLNASVSERLNLMVDLGLGHLKLSRATSTLSAGERQRLGIVRFMARIESHQGQGLLVLDEPTAGLNLADSHRVFSKLADLARTSGHTLIVIEHKLELLNAADWIIEFGPGGGPQGGKVLFQGTYSKLLKASTPSSQAISEPKPSVRSLTNATSEIRDLIMDVPADALPHVTDIFESFVANQEVREDQRRIHPILPIVSLDPARFPDEVRVLEMLDLLPLLRGRCRPELPEGVVGLSGLDLLEEAVRGRTFGFSPVAPQRRLGLATPTDFILACRKLCQIGFKRISSGGRCIALADVAKRAAFGPEPTDYWVVCDSDVTDSLRQIALRWSQGLVRLLDGPDAGTIYATNFLSGDDAHDRIGVPLADPHVGDCRSPSGRCLFCGGTGRLPVYPLELIIADRNSTVADDSFWHPAVLPAIRALRRTRIIPEAKFFSGQMVANFLQPYQRMCDRTAFMFENGIPWRRFLKPTAKRTDRIQDYYSWRGIHDYVYMSIPKVDSKHMKRLKEGFQQQSCHPCRGTGAGWEAGRLCVNGTKLLDLLAENTISWASRSLGIDTPAVGAALELDLGELSLTARYADLPAEQRMRLAVASACAAPLENLAFVVQVSDSLNTSKFSIQLAKQGMSVGAIKRRSEAI